MNSLSHQRMEKARFLALFREIDDYLLQTRPNGPRLNIAICGGAAIAMINNLRGSFDVDILSDGIPKELRVAIAEVGKNHGLPSNWMNDAAKIAVRKRPAEFTQVFNGQRFAVSIPEPEYLLAMKLATMRDRDYPDIFFLLRFCTVRSEEELLEIAEKNMLSKDLTVAFKYKLKDIWKQWTDMTSTTPAP